MRGGDESLGASLPSRAGRRGARITGVVFDLDGTLVDTAADIARAVNAVLAEYGEPPRPVALVRRFIGEGPRTLLAGVYAAAGVDASAARLDEDTDRYLAHYGRAPVVDSTLYADALPALTRLRAQGVRIGVCTNKTQALAETVLRHVGLETLVQVVVGADALPYRKPDPRHLLTTLEHMNTPPAESLFVGDSGIDVACARAAGVECVLVAWAPRGTGGEPPPPRVSCFAELSGPRPHLRGAATGLEPA